MKKVVISFVAGAVLFGGTSAFAASGLLGQKVQGIFTIEKNGVKIADAVVINGSTYAPVRALADVTNTPLTVSGKKIIIGSSSDMSESPIPIVPSNNRTNPATIGSTVNFKNEFGFSGTISINQVIRGEEAWSLIKEANLFNDEAGPGYDYILAKANIKITTNEKSDAAVRMSSAYFDLISSAGAAYDNVLVVPPEPGIDTDMYIGSSHEGWVVFKVKSTDADPVIAFSRNYDGSGGAWFKTK